MQGSKMSLTCSFTEDPKPTSWRASLWTCSFENLCLFWMNCSVIQHPLKSLDFVYNVCVRLAFKLLSTWVCIGADPHL